MRWNHDLPSGRAVRAARGCLLPLLGVLTWWGLPASSAAADEVVFSSNARFRIPYQLDAAEIKRLKATEIQLHVSTDQGKKWRHVDSVPPVAGKFTFEAAQDGVYWFSVRTISEDGRHHPAGSLAAGLKVHVDTSEPTLALELSEPENGEVGLRWMASDDHLDLESLSLEYRTLGSEDWQAIPIVPSDAGETRWSVPEAGTVSVRGRIQDRAGNAATQQAELPVSGIAQPPTPVPAAPVRQSRQPIAEGPLPAEPVTTGDPFARAPDQRPVSTPAAAITSTLPVINPNGSDYSQFVSQREAEATPAPQPAPPASTTAPTPTPAAIPTQAAVPVPRPVAPQLQQTIERPRVRRVNSTNFQIGYVLDDVGPSGVSSVDLFLTEDNGRKWFHYGADDDGTSPFEVSVPQDGTYGFAIRVRSGAGLSEAPPQPGDAPEMTIAVDRVPPQATLLPLKQGNGQRPSQLLIEWTMSDAELADRPVSLYYASHLGGPWQPITGWEPNSGEYLWTVGPDVPKQVYIRLEARDAAGNIARVDSPNPLVIDLSRPTARIIDVESIPGRN